MPSSRLRSLALSVLIAASATATATAAADMADPAPGFNVSAEMNPLIPHLGSLVPHAMTEMPVQGLVAVKSDGEMFFISQNGRYVFQGRAHDLWYDMPLDSMDSVDTSATTLRLARMGLDTRHLNSIVVGDPDADLEAVHTVFIDPFDDHSLAYAAAVHALPAGTFGAVAFVVVPAFGGASQDAAEHFACRTDAVTHAQALDALLEGVLMSLPRLDADECDWTPYRSALLLAEQLRVDGVPFTATADGDVLRGIPDDLIGALRQ